jgi:hypothetical protein
VDDFEHLEMAKADLADLVARAEGVSALVRSAGRLLEALGAAEVTDASSLAEFNVLTGDLKRLGAEVVKENRGKGYDADVRDFGHSLKGVADVFRHQGHPRARAAVLGEALCAQRGLLADNFRGALTPEDLFAPEVLRALELGGHLEAGAGRVLLKVEAVTRSKVVESGRVSPALSLVAPGAYALVTQRCTDAVFLAEVTPVLLETLVALVSEGSEVPLSEIVEAAEEL